MDSGRLQRYMRRYYQVQGWSVSREDIARIIAAAMNWTEQSITLTRHPVRDTSLYPTVIVPHFEMQRRGAVHVRLIVYFPRASDAEFCCVAFCLSPDVFVTLRSRAVVPFMFTLYLILQLRRTTPVWG